ncbi:hypothetical protein EJ08DRAFT_696871 [Tothia fuscella]|uniref:Uncharacterized protein n=1 Tax=Tothia fuscella TaxID=1048955 RepID=A0A9P4TY09_9PEZI|nr:hypothetical protein EJ08DRAFT_696871 [Tothia fuscella]
MPTTKTLFQATAIGHFLVALGHTAKGAEFKDAGFARLRPILKGQAKAGWYQGSLFLTIMGLVNLRWAQDGFKADLIDNGILSLITTICLGSAAWYVKTGDNATAAVLTPMGILQVFAALNA